MVAGWAGWRRARSALRLDMRGSSFVCGFLRVTRVGGEVLWRGVAGFSAARLRRFGRNDTDLEGGDSVEMIPIWRVVLWSE